MKILISNSLYQILQRRLSGFLAGVTLSNGELLITGCMKSDLSDLSSSISKLESFLPSGFQIVGTFSEKIAELESSNSKVHIQLENDEQDGDGEVKVVAWSISNETRANCEIITCDDHKVEQIITSDFIYFKLQTKILVNQFEDETGSAVIEARNEISQQDAVFYMPAFRKLLKPNSLTKKLSNQTVGQVFTSNKKSTPGGGKPLYEIEVVETRIYAEPAPNPSIFAPYIKLNPAEKQRLSSLPIDVTASCFVPTTSTLTELTERLQCCMQRLCIDISNSSSHLISDKSVAVPQYFDYLLPGWLHPVRVCYPANKTDDQLYQYRKEVLHHVFMQAEVPVFRRNLALVLPPPVEEVSDKIVCPHIGLDESRFSRYQVAYVQGRYTYHHYKQDSIDDTGWGCAYRSLQTIISWAKFHGYCNKSVPTHLEIQQTLVKIGDKPKRFIQSTSWIGSIEVQRVLEAHTGMQSRIINLNSGPQIAEKGRELLMHFRTEGTPIMIGGGVLAHTIIGVAFDEVTGATEFVVLDPHYSGGEDLNIIHKKGWCNWKKPKFWDSNTFYNLCLPLLSRKA